MSNTLGNIFGFGDKMKRRLKDAVSNPKEYAEMTADQNQNEWKRDPIERSMGFFNPSPLGSITPFMLRKQIEDVATNMSRREFMKKSAGIAGGTAAATIPGAKLLQKFAPEERAVVKQAAVEAAPKYKYNSLKEYLDDVRASGDEFVDLTAGEGKQVDFMKRRLLHDEDMYKRAKDYKDWAGHPEMDPMTPKELANMHKTLDAEITKFSPQAKKEMKLLKDKSISLDRSYGGTEPEAQVWTDWLINSKGDVDSTLKALQELK